MNPYSFYFFNPELPAATLDEIYEAAGFRMGCHYFSSSFLNYEGRFYHTIWLRICVNGLEYNSSIKKLLKQDTKFRAEIKPLILTNADELLYTSYRENRKIHLMPSIEDNYLFNINSQHMYALRLYDGDRYIALGLFEKGEKSVAGIACYFDYGYQKYSLGKYLMALKMEYCKTQRMDYFYPGYYLPGCAKFDYKTRLATSATEWYNPQLGQWETWTHYDAYFEELSPMLRRLQSLQQALGKVNCNSYLISYPKFDAQQIFHMEDSEFIDVPYVLVMFEWQVHMDHFIGIIYHPRTLKYNAIHTRYATDYCETYYRSFGYKDVIYEYKIIDEFDSEEAVVAHFQELNLDVR